MRWYTKAVLALSALGLAACNSATPSPAPTRADIDAANRDAKRRALCVNLPGAFVPAEADTHMNSMAIWNADRFMSNLLNIPGSRAFLYTILDETSQNPHATVHAFSGDAASGRINVSLCADKLPAGEYPPYLADVSGSGTRSVIMFMTPSGEYDLVTYSYSGNAPGNLREGDFSPDEAAGMLGPTLDNHVVYANAYDNEDGIAPLLSPAYDGQNP